METYDYRTKFNLSLGMEYNGELYGFSSVKVKLVDSLIGKTGVAEWARALTGDRTVNGLSPAAVKTFRFASELWQFRLPRLASVFRMRH